MTTTVAPLDVRAGGGHAARRDAVRVLRPAAGAGAGGSRARTVGVPRGRLVERPDRPGPADRGGRARELGPGPGQPGPVGPPPPATGRQGDGHPRPPTTRCRSTSPVPGCRWSCARRTSPTGRRTGPTGPWRITPNFMVVVPTSHTVTLHYARSGAEKVGIALSVVGRRRARRPDRLAPEGSPSGAGASRIPTRPPGAGPSPRNRSSARRYGRRGP